MPLSKRVKEEVGSQLSINLQQAKVESVSRYQDGGLIQEIGEECSEKVRFSIHDWVATI